MTQHIPREGARVQLEGRWFDVRLRWSGSDQLWYLDVHGEKGAALASIGASPPNTPLITTYAAAEVRKLPEALVRTEAVMMNLGRWRAALPPGDFFIVEGAPLCAEFADVGELIYIDSQELRRIARVVVR